MKDAIKLGLDSILGEVKLGLNFAQISKKFKIPKQTLDYSKSKLVKLGCIEKTSYGVWKFVKEVPNQPKDTINPHSDFKKIRGHAFIWKIVLSEKQNWIQTIENYKKRYSRPKLTFKLLNNDKVPRTIFKNRKIWLTKTGLTIYEPLDFLGDSAPQVKGSAVFEMDLLIKELFEELGLKMVGYEFICSREHFAYVKNQMAKQFNDRKEKISVEYNGRHFWIDHSDGEHEEETDNVVTSVQASKYYQDHVKTNFEVTPSAILNKFESQDKIIDKVLEANEGTKKVMEHLDHNLKTHFEVLNKIAVSQENGNIIFNKILTLLEK